MIKPLKLYSDGKYVKNIWDMLTHVRNHRGRVYFLSAEVKGPKFLKTIIFGLHDIEKFIFLPWLWKYYGAKGAGNPNAKALYIRMNKTGYFIIKCVLALFPFYTSEQVRKMKRFEKIADVIDRHCDPVALEEFNLTTTRPLVQFIRRDDLPCAITFKKRWLNKFGEGLNDNKKPS
jgi:hypothetical protein